MLKYRVFNVNVMEIQLANQLNGILIFHYEIKTHYIVILVKRAILFILKIALEVLKYGERLIMHYEQIFLFI